MTDSPVQDDLLHLPRARVSAAMTGHLVKLIMRFWPEGLARMAAQQGDRPMMAFPDLMRMVEIIGDLPDPFPEFRPDALLRTYPHLADVHPWDLTISGPRGPVGARLYRAGGQPRAALVWIHGGGWVAGDLDGPEAHWVSLELAHRGIAVLSLDYRKAVHGAHYPVPFDDVRAGWAWAQAHLEELGVDQGNVHLGGASAGAGLAAGLATWLRDRGEPQPRSMVLAVPVVHADLPPLPPGELDRIRGAFPSTTFEPSDVTYMTHNYAGTRSALSDPYAFAANADLAGLPDTMIMTSELDSLRTSGETYARALHEAAVPTRHEQIDGAPHAALAIPSSAGGRRSIALMEEWILEHGIAPNG